MHIKEISPNCYEVINPDGTIQGTYPTHREAWRAADRIMGEPINKQEDIAIWLENKKRC